MSGVSFYDPNGKEMVPMRCGSCGDSVGLRSPDWDTANDPLVVIRCYACATTEEAEAITKEASA